MLLSLLRGRLYILVYVKAGDIAQRKSHPLLSIYDISSRSCSVLGDCGRMCVVSSCVCRFFCVVELSCSKSDERWFATSSSPCFY